MSKIVNIITISVFTLLILFSCQKEQIKKEDIASTLDSLEYKLNWLEYRLNLESWQLQTTGISDSLEFYQQLYKNVFSNDKTRNVLRNGEDFLKKEIDKRRLAVIYGNFLIEKIEGNPTIVELRDSLTNLYITHPKNVSKLNRESEFRTFYSIGDKLSDGIANLINLRNQQARNLGYNNYLSMLFRIKNIDERQFLSRLRHLDSLSDEPYRNILAATKTKLNIDEPEIWDIDYAYVDINRQIDNYFPVDSQLKYIKRSLKEVGFNIDNLPIYFDINNNFTKQPYARVFNIDVPYDIRIWANLDNGLYGTQVLFNAISDAIYLTHINPDNTPYTILIDSSWQQGMAQILTSFTNEKEWYTQYAHIPAQLANHFLTAQKEQEIINLRKTLLRAHFEYEAYTNSNRNLNKLYWNLFEKYMLLPPHKDVKIWASDKNLITHPLYWQNYLKAKMIATQSVNYMNKNYGSLINNKMTKSFLIQNYYRFGGRYDWHELLKRGTEEELKPDYWIKQVSAH